MINISLFVSLLYLFLLYILRFSEISRLGHSRHAVTVSESHFVWQSYGKLHEKALGRARKSGAEGAGLNPG